MAITLLENGLCLFIHFQTLPTYNASHQRLRRGSLKSVCMRLLEGQVKFLPRWI